MNIDRTNLAVNAAPRAAAQAPEQCLTFAVNGQICAVPILMLQEIRRYSEPTSLPNLPSHMLGVINLRGGVVPVLDLRMRFGASAPPPDRLTRDRRGRARQSLCGSCC